MQRWLGLWVLFVALAIGCEDEKPNTTSDGDLLDVSVDVPTDTPDTTDTTDTSTGCDPCGEGQVCENGACVCRGAGDVAQRCQDGETCCPDTGCVTTNTDAEHCGTCDSSCGTGELCVAGACACGGAPECGDGQACCGSPLVCTAESDASCVCGTGFCRAGEQCCAEACAATDRDTENCGGCGQRCGPGQSCSASACVCQAGFFDCDSDTSNGCETRIESDPNHCGACGVVCDAGQLCSEGTCVTTCPEGLTACDGGCVNPRENRNHCGVCGLVCDAGSVCADGFCTTSCQPGSTNCGGECVWTDRDPGNCGACGRACASGEVCSAGACVLTCPATTTQCAGSCVDTNRDPNHCSACGVACVPGSRCDSGTCIEGCPEGSTGPACSECEAGYTRHPIGGHCEIPCEEGPGYMRCDGACVPVDDPEHCGACGYTCGDGTCNPDYTCSCPRGFLLCDGVCTAQNTEAHCGACGRACGAGERCIYGVCFLEDTTCGAEGCPGSVCCDGECVSAIAQQVALLARDARNCGGCGIACDIAAGERCVRGSCVDANLSSCSGCTGDGQICCSDGSASECLGAAELMSNTEHCGACGNACAPGEACRNGACLCTAEKTVCNGACVDLAFDEDNCGACGRNCSPGSVCENGRCVPATAQCSSGCTGLCCASTELGEECIEDYKTNEKHCGGCNIACSNNELCLEGECVCPADAGNPNWTRCSGACVQVDRNRDHCGACGSACGAGEICVAGSCVGSTNNDCNCGTGSPDNPEVYLCCDQQQCIGESELRTSPFNCGGCNIACGTGEVCRDGVCECGIDCDGVCVSSLFLNREHCGACGNACEPWEACSPLGDCIGGTETCTMNCGAPQLACCDHTGTEQCIPGPWFTFQPNHCGGCGITCENGEACNAGICSCPSYYGSGSHTFCDGVCTNIDTNSQHCGACGVACPSGEVCSLGQCVGSNGDCSSLGGCGTDQVCCQNANGDLQCTAPAQLASSREHCGACGNDCGEFANCQQGTCVCPPYEPFAECDGVCTDLDRDPLHCGDCDTRCSAGSSCVGGRCLQSNCSLFCGSESLCCRDADGTPECVWAEDLFYNREHCGGCGFRCAFAESCQDGQCVCPADSGAPGYARCDGFCIETLNDRNHCGGCNQPCAAGQACVNGNCITEDTGCGVCESNEICCDGQCLRSDELLYNERFCGSCQPCAEGEYCEQGQCACDANGVTTDICGGACTSLQHNDAHCGACDQACNAGEECRDGQCVTATQDCTGGCPGRDVCCDGRCRNLDWDTSACGACGTVCSGAESCRDGVCTCPTERSEYEDCNGTCTLIVSDNANCGGCGITCGSGEACILGQCTTGDGTNCAECSQQAVCCSDPNGDLCSDLTYDVNHCGACGVSCNRFERCSQGQCVCDVGNQTVVLCDGVCSDLRFDQANCGGCGSACASDEICMNGNCVFGDRDCSGACDADPTQLCCTDSAGSSCRSPRSDPFHCGECGIGCRDDEVCSDGVCRCPENNNYRFCDGRCTHIYGDDDRNCGGCGIVCSGACVNGNCQ